MDDLEDRSHLHRSRAARVRLRVTAGVVEAEGQRAARPQLGVDVVDRPAEVLRLRGVRLGQDEVPLTAM
jgi:hypothetical protein